MKPIKRRSCLNERASGILIHPTSLPSAYGIGNIGQAAHRFIELLTQLNQTYWQMLPINPIGQGFSPYSSRASFAVEPLLIDPEGLWQRGLISSRQLLAIQQPEQRQRINYPLIQKNTTRLLKQAFERFKPTQSYHHFCQQQRYWLDDYCLFEALSQKFKTTCWYNWPKDLRSRHPKALKQASRDLDQFIQYHKFVQFIGYQQWQDLQTLALRQKIKLIGDLPIYVSAESADVWAHQKYFDLKRDGHLRVVAGVPPDSFNPKGQLWGNALYHWNALQQDHFRWWVKRIQHAKKLFDLIRLDHFIGFYRYWEIPAHAQTAQKGRWRYPPGNQLLLTLQKHFDPLPLIAEDLGIMIKQVTELRQQFNIPGMKVLQLGYHKDKGALLHRPHHMDTHSVAYTGTHDNNTSVGWIKDILKASQSKNSNYFIEDIISCFGRHPKIACQNMIRDVMKSQAMLAIIPMQDLLALDEKARMNIPGVAKGNWSWRFSLRQQEKQTAMLNWFAQLTQATERGRPAQKHNKKLKSKRLKPKGPHRD